MTNIYHILAKPPALEVEDIYIEIEALAQALVKSGRFRVTADDRYNFVRFSLPYDGINLMFSHREVHDPDLLPRTEAIIAEALTISKKRKNTPQNVKKEIEKLKVDLDKCPEVSPEMEIKLARALIQSAHPIVIKLLLLEGVEVFVSYSHNISDLLDIRSYQTAGQNAGMQSTDSVNVAVYVSCGGDPFISEERKRHNWDGFPALARLMVIGGQELGHYADIKRDAKGRQVSRHSADFGGKKAKRKVKIGRINDIKVVEAITVKLQQLGLQEIVEAERHIKFYEKHRKGSRILNRTKRKALRMTKRFVRRCLKSGLDFVTKFPQKERLASHISMSLADMRFNLAPQADVYKSDDPDEEEAIACIEALARVPQQVVKWGHLVTSTLMPNLYQIYYGEVIPACIKSYETMSGQKYEQSFTKIKVPIWKKVFRFFKKLVGLIRKKKK